MTLNRIIAMQWKYVIDKVAVIFKPVEKIDHGMLVQRDWSKV